MDVASRASKSPIWLRFDDIPYIVNISLVYIK